MHIAQKDRYTTIGLMSGTSYDGVDAALLYTDGNDFIEFREVFYKPYTPTLRARIKAVIDGDYSDIWATERDLTAHHADVVKNLMATAGIKSSEVDVIGFHGQTIKHDPSNKITVQLGNAPMLSYEAKCPVIHDFRSSHVASGKEGAPLIPMFLKALKPYKSDSYCYLNIGGVSNITYISEGSVIGFDVGIGNAAADDIVKQTLGLDYDSGGDLAKKGSAHQSILSSLKTNDYFSKPYPKSLDRNAFDFSAFKNISVEDSLATLAEFLAFSVAEAIKLLPSKPKVIMVSGGGRKNNTILAKITELCGIPAVNIDEYGLDGDMLEAQGFGYLAVRSIKRYPCFVGSNILSGSYTSAN